MKSDEDVRKDVESELRWDPALDTTGVVVTVKDGVVTLTGFIRSFNEKWEAEDVAKRVAGVLGVANDLDVRLPSISQRPDPDIARDAVTALNYELPDLIDVKVVVKDGLVRLEGEVGSYQQRHLVARAVGRVRGVKGIVNTIKVRSPGVAPGDIHRQIKEALERNALVQAANIVVEANGNEVVLKGEVGSWAARKEADEAAWRAPGVVKVDNRITIAGQDGNPRFERREQMTRIPWSDGPRAEAMNLVLANNWWAVALRGVAAILFGIAAFAAPLITILALVLVFAAFSFVDGVFGIVMSVRGARKGERWIWLLLNGILGIVASAVAILWPGITVLAFVMLVAAWALVSGTFMLISAFRLKIDHGRVWLVIGGIASVVLGILLVISPLIGALVLTFWIGAYALVLGATLLVLAYKLRSHRTGQPSNLAASGAA